MVTDRCWEIQPREEIKCPHCGKKAIKHIHKEGARYHVMNWDTHGGHCSEKDCEMNHGPGKCIPEKIPYGC